MRRLIVTAAALFLLGAGSAAAAWVPPFPRLFGTWSHAEINVTVNGTPHTLILDRGRIVQLSPTQLTLRERDGSRAVVRLSPATIVRIDGVLSTVLDLKVRMRAETMRIDGGPAVRVRAVTPVI